MTLQGLQYFGARGDDTARAVRDLGCKVCRVQLFTDHDDAALVSNETAATIDNEVLNAGMMPYVIIRTPEQVSQVPPGHWIEFYNEPDLEQFNMPLSQFKERYMTIVEACAGRNPLAIGGVSNLNDRGMRFLKQLEWDKIPPEVACSHHWYPDDDRPHESHIETGFLHKKRNTRDQDIADLKAIVGERPLVNSETGFWDGPFRTESDVAEWYRVERHFWERQGYAIVIAYQLDSEAPPSDPNQWGPQHGYGLRRVGTVSDWKPSADAWFA